MSLVVVNASGPITTTLPLISSVPGGTITIKDSGSASATNTITIVATAGNTFEIGTSYVLNTPLAYATFIGNPITLKWRVLGITNPDTPLFTSTIVNSNTGTIGGATATINTLTVSGIATLGNTSNTGNLGVGGITTLNTVSATNLNFSGGLYSNGILFTGGSASPNFSTISTIGQAAFYSSMQIQGGLSVFSTITARNINFNGLLTSNGTTIVGSPPGINSAGSIGINSASNASYALLVTGNQSNTGTLGVAGAAAITGSFGTTGGFYGKLSTELWINSTDDRPRLSYTNNSHSHYRTANSHLFRNSNDSIIFTIDANGSINTSGNAVVTGTLTATGGFTGRLLSGNWFYTTDNKPRLLFDANSHSYYRSANAHIFRNNNDTDIFTVETNGQLTVGGGSGASACSFIRMNQNPGNTNWSYVSSTETLGDVSLCGNCYTSNGNWYPVNNFGNTSFVSARQGFVKIWTSGSPSDLPGTGRGDGSLPGFVSVTLGGNWAYTSDERLKENITPLENCLEFITSVRTVRYTFKNFTTITPNLGFIAQDFETAYPEVITKDTNGILNLIYSDTIPIVVSAMKELNTIVKGHASTITGMQSDSDLKTSTITGLQSALDSQQSTITSILSKLST